MKTRMDIQEGKKLGTDADVVAAAAGIAVEF